MVKQLRSFLKISCAFVLCIGFLCSGVAFAAEHSQLNISTVIEEYFQMLDDGVLDNMPDLFVVKEQDELSAFINENSNNEGHIGLFNYASVELISCLEVSADNDLRFDLFIDDWDSYNNLRCWECYVDVTTYRDTKYLAEGENRFFIYTAADQHNEDRIVKVIRDSSYIPESDISLNTTDAPRSNPDDGVWVTPETINVRGYGELDFKRYCTVVLANEFQGSYTDNSRRACGMAVKNFAWHHILVQPYSNYEYDITSTAQLYDPNKAIADATEDTINYIWDYVMLSCDYKLFRAFYRTDVSDNAHASYHGGMLSHNKAAELGNANSSWEEILHYFYDYGTYNSEMTPGVIRIVNLNHEQTGYMYDSTIYTHWIECSTCGCIHFESNHNWIYDSGISKYRCTVCGLTSTNIPSIMQKHVESIK